MTTTIVIQNRIESDFVVRLILDLFTTEQKEENSNEPDDVFSDLPCTSKFDYSKMGNSSSEQRNIKFNPKVYSSGESAKK